MVIILLYPFAVTKIKYVLLVCLVSVFLSNYCFDFFKIDKFYLSYLDIQQHPKKGPCFNIGVIISVRQQQDACRLCPKENKTFFILFCERYTLRCVFSVHFLYIFQIFFLLLKFYIGYHLKQELQTYDFLKIFFRHAVKFLCVFVIRGCPYFIR